MAGSRCGSTMGVAGKEACFSRVAYFKSSSEIAFKQRLEVVIKHQNFYVTKEVAIIIQIKCIFILLLYKI